MSINNSMDLQLAAVIKRLGALVGASQRILRQLHQFCL